MSAALKFSQTPQAFKHRVVLLGASNIARGVSTVVATAQNALDGPLEIMAAVGHGRSFGQDSRVLGRSLPGITQCGLWEALDQRSPVQTSALITDIGNDLLYGVEVEKILEWLENCFQRLRRRCDHITITELPMDSLKTLGMLRFLFMKSILFPHSRISLREVLGKAEKLNSGVIELANRWSVSLVKPSFNWYGLDPIHIKRRHWPLAWKKIFQAMSQKDFSPISISSPQRWLYLRSLRPLHRTMFGVPQHQPQPAGKLTDGSTISFY